MDYCSAVASSSGGKFRLKISKNLFLEECHWSENQVIVFSWCSVRVDKIQCFGKYGLNYIIMVEVWRKKYPKLLGNVQNNRDENHLSINLIFLYFKNIS